MESHSYKRDGNWALARYFSFWNNKHALIYHSKSKKDSIYGQFTAKTILLIIHLYTKLI